MKRFVLALVLMATPVVLAIAMGVGLVIGRHYSAADSSLRDQVALLNHNLESHRHRRATEDRYDVRIVGAATKFTAGTTPSTIEGEPPKEQQLLDALPSLLKELDRYPVDAIKSAGIHRIVLCGTLSIGHQTEGGLADPASSTMYLSIPGWDADGSSLPRSLDHEIFHFIDQTVHEIGTCDMEWGRLNQSDFTYGKGGYSATGDMASTEMTDKWPGFVTPYCRSAPEEDKAETFACMMTAADEIVERSRTDPIVAAKVKLIRKRCAELCPELKP